MARLLIGHAVDRLKQLPPESVELVVTSPPYFDLKDYGVEGQIGFGQTYVEYLHSMADVIDECVRVLRPGCKIAVVIGDQFVRASEQTEYKIRPLQADLIGVLRTVNNLTFLGNIIWQKITTTNTSGGGSWMGSTYYPRDGYVTYEHEYVLLWRKPGTAPSATDVNREASKLTKEQRSKWFRGIWQIPGEKKHEHIAAFPIEIPDRLIRMFTFIGETVLDPFAGSGTTLVAAAASGRRSIGIDLDPKYAVLIEDRLRSTVGLLEDLDIE